MAFDAKHKKVVASDMKLATTMEHPANFEDRLFCAIHLVELST